MEYNGFTNFIMFGKTFGLKNLALFYRKRWDLCKLPLALPVFGIVRHREELLNIRDNILRGYIRDSKMERQLRKSKHPVIVDCGINVGVTARWWFYLNPQATVYGIDMIQEANDFTVKALPPRFKEKYIPITGVLAYETGQAVEISYDDPLCGGNNAGISSGYSEKRQLRSVTLDDCLHNYSIDAIDLLKVDIEDSAARMFKAATHTLPKVKNILLEVHTEKEREGSLSLLREKGFHIRRSYKRHLWLQADKNASSVL